MPYSSYHEPNWTQVHAIHKAIDAHYRARGVPETRLAEMRHRYIKSKGLRRPGGQ